MHLPGTSGSPDVLTHLRLRHIAKRLRVSIGLYVDAKGTVCLWVFLVFQQDQAIPRWFLACQPWSSSVGMVSEWAHCS